MEQPGQELSTWAQGTLYYPVYEFNLWSNCPVFEGIRIWDRLSEYRPTEDHPKYTRDPLSLVKEPSVLWTGKNFCYYILNRHLNLLEVFKHVVLS